MSIIDLPELLTKAEAAPLLRVKPKTIERLMLTRELTPTRIGRKVFVRRDELAAYIERMTLRACRKDCSSIATTGLTSDPTAGPRTFTASGTRSATVPTDKLVELRSALRTLRRPKTA